MLLLPEDETLQYSVKAQSLVPLRGGTEVLLCQEALHPKYCDTEEVIFAPVFYPQYVIIMMPIVEINICKDEKGNLKTLTFFHAFAIDSCKLY
jgi:hypothetical protein